MRVLSHVGGRAVQRIRDEVPEVEVVEIPTEGPLPDVDGGDVLWTFAWGTPNLADALATGVRWVHALGTGVDAFPIEAVRGRTLTCSRGASAVPIAEWTLATMLAFEKQLPESWVTEPPAQWSWARLGTLAGRDVAIVGLGGIGAAVARLALAFGMQVRAVRRRRLPSPVPEVEVVDDLLAALSGAHHVVLAAPATPATHALLDRRALGAVGPGAHLVNVARGALVDADALREALDDGRVARASLDTVDPEPLPAGHWLYTHPSVRLSPHISWSAPGATDILVDAFVANLRRWIAGEPLAGVVEPDEGY